MSGFQLGRRGFLLAGASCVASAAQAQRRAGDRIQVGVIGLGSRGYNLIDSLISHDGQATIVAICDVDKNHYRDRPWGTGTAFGLLPAQAKIQSAYAKGGSPNRVDTYSDFRDLIARPDIDAVVVATPDHWHALCTMTALQAGKDVYCEKPVTHLFAEGQQIYQEVARRQAVFQTGSQQRSDWRFRRVVQLVRGGHLGKISKVEVGLPAGYSKPQGDTEVIAVPEDLDYDFWCGPAPKLPYMRARHHRWWRGHRAFGGGVLMDWIGHHNDIAHWALNVDRLGPNRVEAVDWTFPQTDVYDTPEIYTIRCEYEGGVKSTISTQNENGLRIVGSDGWVFVDRGKLNASDPRWTVETFDPGTADVYQSDDHMGNFLDCIRSRSQCIAPAEVAHRSITPGHLGYVSNALGRPLAWDPKVETVTGDDQANELLMAISYRAPWNLASRR